jgi:hypothetical protein
MKKRKVLTERMTTVELYCRDHEKPGDLKYRGRVRVDSSRLLQLGGRPLNAEAWEVMSESDMIRNGLSRMSQVSLH